MEKSVNTISKTKFAKLSCRRQHALLVSLARFFSKEKDYQRFRKRYAELQSWADLDRYVPPPWLSEKEAIAEFIRFHQNFCSGPSEVDVLDLPFPWQAKFDVEVVLDQIRSPYNVGSVLRLIDNFGLKGMVHASSWLRLDHPQLKKAARGCEQWIPVRFAPDLISYIEKAAVPVIGIENTETAVPVHAWTPPGAGMLILGNEAYGIAAAIRKRCSNIVSIPMHGFKKSMNVHHALAVIANKISETA